MEGCQLLGGATTFVPSLPWLRSYAYSVQQYSYTNGKLQTVGSPFRQIFRAADIDREARTFWWIYLPANYHNSFYYNLFHKMKAIPTQATGAVGDSIAVILMKRLFGAYDVHAITPHPSSQSADFKMKMLDVNGQIINVAVESKGTNNAYDKPPPFLLRQGSDQLAGTQQLVNLSFGAKFLIVTSYRSKKSFIIRVN